MEGAFHLPSVSPIIGFVVFFDEAAVILARMAARGASLSKLFPWKSRGARNGHKKEWKWQPWA
ncbi:MAG: hypothetical protein ABSF45_00280 [Terriglobia bacterium]